MDNTTKDKLVKAIEVLVEKVYGDIKPDEALKFTQAAANAANAMSCLHYMKKE